MFSFSPSVLKKHLPEDAFGIFTTVRRHRILPQWPVDIHGCIGYWDHSWKTIPSSELFEKWASVSHSAMWSDQRRQHFDPIETDPDTVIEYDFMMKPVQEIDPSTGIIRGTRVRFTNEEYGIILHSASGTKRATYLPHVFPASMPWSDLVDSILNKAGLSKNEPFTLHAYQITQWTVPLKHIALSFLYSYWETSTVLHTLMESADSSKRFFLPYSFTKEGRPEWKDDEVRGLSVLADTIKYVATYPSIWTAQEIQMVLSVLEKVIPTIQSPQALSFIGHLYTLSSPSMSPRLPDKQKYCQWMLENIQSAEETFEQPERIIGAKHASCSLDRLPSLSLTKHDSIFRINWVIQSRRIQGHEITLPMIQHVVRATDKVLRDVHTAETNELAVLFEALCYVHDQYPNETDILLFRIWFELEKRKHENGLYAFLDGRTRCDITTHILNGYYELHRHAINH
jgi:hypothetical protein